MTEPTEPTDFRYDLCKLPDVIVLTGRRQSGKDEFWRAVRYQRGATRMGFADSLYAVMSYITTYPTSWLRENKHARPEILGGKTVGYALQTLGTEWGRELINPDIWARKLTQTLHTQLSDDLISVLKPVIIPDCRFVNEWDAVVDYCDKYNMSRILINIVRPDRSNVEDDGRDDTHPSEIEQIRLQPDATFYNTGGLADYHSLVHAWMRSYRRQPEER